MRIVEWIGIGVLVLLGALGALFARRELISRTGGTIEVNYRLSTMVPGRGWSPGLGRFRGDELRWYRVFSFAIRPRRTLSRRTLAVLGRRAPEPVEQLAFPPNWVVLRCSDKRGPFEIAMAEATLTGFLSWMESAPPGTAPVRFAA